MLHASALRWSAGAAAPARQPLLALVLVLVLVRLTALSLTRPQP